MPALSPRSATRARPSPDRQPNWAAGLPDEWREQVVIALDFAEHREYEMPASRCFGYDEAGQGCYYAHDYALESLRSDDDESFYHAITYAESVRAWRLRDGRWLYLHQAQHEEGGAQRAFFTLSNQAPSMPNHAASRHLT